MNWNEVDLRVKEWLKEARKQIVMAIKTELTVQTKSNANDLVTNVDTSIEEFFVHKIQESFPEHKILGEEGYGNKIESVDGIIWIIDPIDGTMNFIHQKRNFYISIGVYEDGVGKLGYLYDVMLDELYYALSGKGAFFNESKLPSLENGKLEEAILGFNPFWISSLYANHQDSLNVFLSIINDVRGIRSYGSAAMEFAYVATGRMDAYLSLGLSPWDFAGGKVIVESLGGVVSDIRGNPVNILEKGSVLAAKPAVHEKLVNHYLKHL